MAEPEPSDAEFLAMLMDVDQASWDALRDALDGLGEGPCATWAGGDVVGTAVVDGVEKPLSQMPYAINCDALERLMSALRSVVPVVPFDWGTWGGLNRYPRGTGLEAAPVTEAMRMVTAIVRGDRFIQGLISSCAEDGTLRAVIARLRAWHDS